jgi:hypothetical protein
VVGRDAGRSKEEGKQMNRRSVFSLAGMAAVGVVMLLALNGTSTHAQDTTVARLDSLETRVSVVETKIAGNGASSTPSSSASSGGLTFTGSGEMLTSKFHLDPGSYIVDVNVSGGQDEFAEVDLREAGRSFDVQLLTVFNGSPFKGTLLVDVPDWWNYRLVSTGSPSGKWTVTFRKE